jgi:16S rRNA (guanine966-N2)-methyltransferase
MRIIAGSAKGRKISTPEGMETRPTRDRVRESIFAILQFRIPDTVVLDAFAGSGAMGLEALSRGAKKSVFIDRSAGCARLIRENAERLGFSDRCTILNDSFDHAIKSLVSRGERFDYIFLDPPYGSNDLKNALELVFDNDVLAPEGVAIAEYPSDMKNPPAGHYDIYDIRRYGKTAVSFIRR